MAKKPKISSTDCLGLFAARVDEITETEIAKSGFRFRLALKGDPRLNSFPSRDDFIAFLTFFRQFFLHDAEPVSVKGVLSEFRRCVRDEELLNALNEVEKHSPFNSSLRLGIRGRVYAPREMVESWISRYFHADRIPPELKDLSGEQWQYTIAPILFYFSSGVQILQALRSLILEAESRGYFRLRQSLSRPVV
jgi:hypothetical protein